MSSDESGAREQAEAEKRMQMLDRVYVPAQRVLEGMGFDVDRIKDVLLTADSDWDGDVKHFTVTIKARVKR